MPDDTASDWPARVSLYSDGEAEFIYFRISMFLRRRSLKEIEKQLGEAVDELANALQRLLEGKKSAARTIAVNLRLMLNRRRGDRSFGEWPTLKAFTWHPCVKARFLSSAHQAIQFPAFWS